MRTSPKLSSEYAQTYRRLLAHILAAPTTNLTAFWPQVDPEFVPGKSWLYIGRAVNGWGNENDEDRPTQVGPGGTNSVDSIRQFSEEADSETEPSPLAWMERTDTRWLRGPFRAIIRWLNADTDEIWRHGWSRGMAWSNLYKFAPWDGGNPSDELCRRQFEFCKQLLEMEIRTLRPQLVVVLAGPDWYGDFATDVTPPVQPSTGVVMGQLFGHPAVLAPHPGQANRAGLGPKTLGKTIVDAWRGEL